MGIVVLYPKLTNVPKKTTLGHMVLNRRSTDVRIIS